MSYEKEYRHCLENTNKRELVDKIIYDEKEFIKKDKEIERLNKENKQLKVQIEEYQKALDETMSEKIDIQNNWNELKEFIVKEYYMYLPLEASTKPITILIDKMQELQGSDSNG